MTQSYRQIVKSTGLVGIGQVVAILINMVRVKVLALLVGTAGMGLAFALGSRDAVRGILAGHYLRQSLPVGEPIELAGERGVVEKIGPVSTTLRNEQRTWSVPNVRLLDEVIDF